MKRRLAGEGVVGSLTLVKMLTLNGAEVPVAMRQLPIQPSSCGVYTGKACEHKIKNKKVSPKCTQMCVAAPLVSSQTGKHPGILQQGND